MPLVSLFSGIHVTTNQNLSRGSSISLLFIKYILQRAVAVSQRVLLRWFPFLIPLFLFISLLEYLPLYLHRDIVIAYVQ